MKYIKEFEDYVPPRIGNRFQNFKPLGHDKFKIGDIVKTVPNSFNPHLLRHDYFKILMVDIEEKEGVPYLLRDILNKSFAFWVNETEIVSITSEELEKAEMKLQAKKYNIL